MCNPTKINTFKSNQDCSYSQTDLNMYEPGKYVIIPATKTEPIGSMLTAYNAKIPIAGCQMFAGIL